MTRTDSRTLAVIAAITAAGCLTPAAAHAAVDTSSFVGAWSAAPIAPATGQPFGFPLSATVSVPLEFVNSTIRQRVHPNIGGTAVRIRLSNRFGDRPVTFSNVHVGQAMGPPGEFDTGLEPGSGRKLLFGGKDAVTIPPGQRMYSDPVAMKVTAFKDLQVSFFIPKPSGPATQHTLAGQVNFLAPGDRAADESGGAFVPSGTASFFITDVDVKPVEPSGSLVVIGDSVTDGFLYTQLNANNRYTDFLARRVRTDPTLRNLSIINQGISGNRVLTDNIGPSALNRLEADALSQPNVKAVVLAAGINDLANPPFIGTTDTTPKTADEVIAGMKKFAARVKAAGKKFYAATITPVGDLTAPAGPPFATYSLPPVNEARQKINAWIRTSGTADGVFDFDKVLADPASPNHTKPKFAGIDGVHPSDAGYQAMAESIDTAKLRNLAPPPFNPAPKPSPRNFCVVKVLPRSAGATLDRGLRADAHCALKSTLRATLTVTPATARRLGLPARTVASGRATGVKRRTVAVRFTRAARAALAGRGAVRATLTLTARSGALTYRVSTPTTLPSR